MASIKDAIEESTNEANVLTKYIIYTLPLFGAVYFYMQGQQNTFLFYLLAFTSIMIVVGIMIKCCNNVMNFRERIMPTFNIFSIFFDAIRALIAITPAAAINGYITYLLVTKIYPMIAIDWIRMSAEYITYAVCGAMILTVFMLFAKKFSFIDAFDFKAISDSCIDVLIQAIWMLLQVAIIDAVIAGSITYLFWLFIGLENVVTYFVWCMTVVFNAALIGNYLGQLNYEALHQEEAKAKSKKEKEEIEAIRNSNGPTSPSTF